MPTLVALSAGTFVCILVKAWAQPILAVVLGASVCLAFVTLIIVYKGDIIAQRDNSAGTLNYSDVPQAISKEDHKFLDDLSQQQSQERDSKPAPRAELIVNTSEVKRARLVVNGRVVERAQLVRPRHQ